MSRKKISTTIYVTPEQMELLKRVTEPNRDRTTHVIPTAELLSVTIDQLGDEVDVDAVVAAAQLASDHPEIAELDLNPVIVSEAGAVVTDAVIRLIPHVVDDGPLRRLD